MPILKCILPPVPLLPLFFRPSVPPHIHVLSAYPVAILSVSCPPLLSPRQPFSPISTTSSTPSLYINIFANTALSVFPTSVFVTVYVPSSLPSIPVFSFRKSVTTYPHSLPLFITSCGLGAHFRFCVLSSTHIENSIV